MNNNIYYINDIPFSLGYGGKEVQLLGYKELLENSTTHQKVELLDHWDRDAFRNDSIIHLFGSSKWFHTLIGQALQKPRISKIILSPTFYYRDTWKLHIGNFLSKLTPLQNQFSHKKYIFEFSDLIVVNSNSEGEQIQDVFGNILKNKMVKIFNTIPDNFNSFLDINCFLSTYNIEPGYVLSVGFHDERKNSIKMIQAFLKVYPLIKKKLVLIGASRFQSDANALAISKLIAENKDKIIHIPFLQTGSDLIKSAYYNCSVHVLPSFVETPGIANLEAMAFGKNIVVGKCKPVVEYFEDNAFYCNPNSVEDISKAIYLAHSSSFDSCKLSSFVNERYTHKCILNELHGIYKN